MDEQRTEAYLNLIDEILNCPHEEAFERLNAHPDLLDAGLLQVMFQVADILIIREMRIRQMFYLILLNS